MGLKGQAAFFPQIICLMSPHFSSLHGATTWNQSRMWSWFSSGPECGAWITVRMNGLQWKQQINRPDPMELAEISLKKKIPEIHTHHHHPHHPTPLFENTAVTCPLKPSCFSYKVVSAAAEIWTFWAAEPKLDRWKTYVLSVVSDPSNRLRKGRKRWHFGYQQLRLDTAICGHYIWNWKENRSNGDTPMRCIFLSFW